MKKTIIAGVTIAAVAAYYWHTKATANMDKKTTSQSLDGWGNSATNFPTMMTQANAANYDLYRMHDQAQAINGL